MIKWLHYQSHGSFTNGTVALDDHNIHMLAGAVAK
jgi:hypothetical protein